VERSTPLHVAPQTITNENTIGRGGVEEKEKLSSQRKSDWVAEKESAKTNQREKQKDAKLEKEVG